MDALKCERRGEFGCWDLCGRGKGEWELSRYERDSSSIEWGENTVNNLSQKEQTNLNVLPAPLRLETVFGL